MIRISDPRRNGRYSTSVCRFMDPRTSYCRESHLFLSIRVVLSGLGLLSTDVVDVIVCVCSEFELEVTCCLLVSFLWKNFKKMSR